MTRLRHAVTVKVTWPDHHEEILQTSGGYLRLLNRGLHENTLYRSNAGEITPLEPLDVDVVELPIPTQVNSINSVGGFLIETLYDHVITEQPINGVRSMQPTAIATQAHIEETGPSVEDDYSYDGVVGFPHVVRRGPSMAYIRSNPTTSNTTEFIYGREGGGRGGSEPSQFNSILPPMYERSKIEFIVNNVINNLHIHSKVELSGTQLVINTKLTLSRGLNSDEERVISEGEDWVDLDDLSEGKEDL